MDENDSKAIADMINDGTRELVGDFTPRASLINTELSPEDGQKVAGMINDGTRTTLEKRRAEEDRIIRQNLIDLRWK